MTPREIADLMNYVEKNPKAEIEAANFGDQCNGWVPIGVPLWNFGNGRYRIKPRRLWARYMDGGQHCATTPPTANAISEYGWIEFVEVIR
ncbi:hypothetical protein [Nevskia ramosa]|uniref:hypothetical protein n=1 Tax=Nevskia ramosa TaxID=64002 RepID=UPI003D0E994B